jgi:hypothetical protein
LNEDAASAVRAACLMPGLDGHRIISDNVHRPEELSDLIRTGRRTRLPVAGSESLRPQATVNCQPASMTFMGTASMMELEVFLQHVSRSRKSLAIQRKGV